MNKHLNQCNHNEDFLNQLCISFPGSFNEWKITAIFYCVTHLIRGHALFKGEMLGDRHNNVFDFLEKISGKDSKACKAFYSLYRNCRDCRYSGFTTRENFERICEIKLNESRVNFSIVKSYLILQGLVIDN
jgi:hypothetical protein